MSDLRASFVLDLAGNFGRNARRFRGDYERLTRTADRSTQRLARTVTGLNRGLSTLQNRYAAAIGGAAATAAIVQSGRLDKRLTQVGQTAGANREQIQGLRDDLFEMATKTGQPIDELLGGFEDLVQAGNSWGQALAIIRAVNPALAVTGSEARALTSALSVAGEMFDFDLSQIQVAAAIIDQMTVAGRLGNAELEDLSSIFGRVGGNAKAANLEFVDTLAFIEQLSKVERDPARLATLADSTLRLFTNDKYRSQASQRSGVAFFNKDGSARDALQVLDDIAAGYRKLATDAQRAAFVGSVFEGTDLDTQRGLRQLLAGDALGQVRAIATEIRSAGGTIARDLPDALKNSVDQSARLKNTLRDAADEFAQPVNKAIADLIQFGLDDAGVTGKGIVLTGAGAAVSAKAIATAAELVLLKRISGQIGKQVTQRSELGGTPANPLFVVDVGRAGKFVPGRFPGGGRRPGGTPAGRPSGRIGTVGNVAAGLALVPLAIEVAASVAEGRRTMAASVARQAARASEIDKVKTLDDVALRSRAAQGALAQRLLDKTQGQSLGDDRRSNDIRLVLENRTNDIVVRGVESLGPGKVDVDAGIEQVAVQ